MPRVPLIDGECAAADVAAEDDGAVVADPNPDIAGLDADVVEHGTWAVHRDPDIITRELGVLKMRLGHVDGRRARRARGVRWIKVAIADLSSERVPLNVDAGVAADPTVADVAARVDVGHANGTRRDVPVVVDDGDVLDADLLAAAPGGIRVIDDEAVESPVEIGLVFAVPEDADAPASG